MKVLEIEPSGSEEKESFSLDGLTDNYNIRYDMSNINANSFAVITLSLTEEIFTSWYASWFVKI